MLHGHERGNKKRLVTDLRKEDHRAGKDEGM
jgi:hypothetical protein